jgi:hypothetical protein
LYIEVGDGVVVDHKRALESRANYRIGVGRWLFKDIYGQYVFLDYMTVFTVVRCE